jgi:hypothetical protein
MWHTPFGAKRNLVICIELEKITYVKASLLKARNTVKDAKNPVFKPIVWHVDAYDKLS